MESFLRLGIESPPPACFAFHHSPCVVVYRRDQGCTVVEPTVQKQLACNMQILRALDRDPRSFVPCENVRASAQLCRVHAQRDLHIPREHRPMSMTFQTCHHLPRARHHLYCACARHAMSAPACRMPRVERHSCCRRHICSPAGLLREPGTSRKPARPLQPPLLQPPLQPPPPTRVKPRIESP